MVGLNGGRMAERSGVSPVLGDAPGAPGVGGRDGVGVAGWEGGTGWVARWWGEVEDVGWGGGPAHG
jgi:hypothetical protein